MDNQKNSNNAPDWFHVMPEWKIKQFKDYIAKNEDTINILSKHQNWITTSPLTNDRRHPFEKQKASNIGTSKIMPKWMEIKFKNTKKEENLKSIEYYPIRQKCKKQMVFVDKELNPKKIKALDFNKNKSIFSYGDFRRSRDDERQDRDHDEPDGLQPDLRAEQRGDQRSQRAECEPDRHQPGRDALDDEEASGPRWRIF